MKKKMILAIFLALGLSSLVVAENTKVQTEKKIEMKQTINKDIYNKIRIKWVDYLSGNKFFNNLSDEEKKEYILSLNQSTLKVLNTLNKDKASLYIFEDLKNMKNGVEINNAYNKIKILTRSYSTQGTEYYKSPELKKTIIDLMDWLNGNAYYIGAPEYGNWWQWELGIPKAINEIVAFMYEDIPQNKRESYLKTSEYFQPLAKYSGVSPSAKYSSSPDKRVSVGGNRMDTMIISFMRGVLMNDSIQVLDGLSSVVDVAEYVKEGDGFYKDGSFIQHGNIAYNGTYASVLFDGLGTVLYLTKDTEFEIKDKKLNNIYEVIIDGYKYLFINGGITDSVSGRSISRDNTSDLTRGTDLISKIALISEGAPTPYKEKLKELIKITLIDNTEKNTVEKIRNSTLKNLLENIQNDNLIEGKNIEGVKIFPSMDRVIYKTKKEGKISIAMHSSRIGNYETMNDENIKGWHTGDGLTYIYGKDSSQFTNFWPTVDMYHLSGTTENMKERTNKSGERRHKIKMNPNSWTGGATNGEVAMIGMDYSSWNDSTKAKKSWFIVDDVVIAVGSNITSIENGEVHTTIDNRIIKNKGINEVLLNGSLLGSGIEKKPSNLLINLEGNIANENFSYKILEANNVIVKKDKRSGSWKDIGGKNSKKIEKNYFTAYINHGKNPNNASYTYVIMPLFDKIETINYDFDSIKTIEKNENVHYLKKGNVEAINFWKDSPYKSGSYKTYSTLSMIAKQTGDILELWISEPTQLSKIKSILEVDGEYSLVESSDPNIIIKKLKSKIKLQFDTKSLSGNTVFIKLKKTSK